MWNQGIGKEGNNLWVKKGLGDLESGSNGFKENSPCRDHIELKVKTGAIHSEKQTLLYNVSFDSPENSNKYHCNHFVQGECESCLGGLVAKSWPTLLWLGKLLCPWDFPGKNAGLGCHSLLQGIFPDPGIEPVSPALTGGSSLLSHQASLRLALTIIKLEYMTHCMSWLVWYHTGRKWLNWNWNSEFLTLLWVFFSPPSCLR